MAMDYLPSFSLEWLLGFGGIMLIDLVLSGDNAVVIALASKNLPPNERKLAIRWGSAAAVGLRIVLTFTAASLLDIPYLRFAGGLALIWIAIKLLDKDESEVTCHKAACLREAIKMIVLADVIMSLDNVLALAGVANTVPEGKYLLIVLGLLASIPLVMFGAQILSHLMDRFPIIVYAGAGILGYAASEMIATDPALHAFTANYQTLLHITLVVLVLVVGYVQKHRAVR